ncbi:hypothetical protein GCM10027068_07260 [Prescottella soli]
MDGLARDHGTADIGTADNRTTPETAVADTPEGVPATGEGEYRLEW